jgi:sigma-B regulation protein RsbU (phosphoserine phosphatase)
MRILIAEDEKTSRRILEKALSRAGHQVLAVEDGIKALACIQKEVPEMLITDWMMPDLDGLDLCRRVRGLNLPSYVYIILWTALTQKENIITGLDAGADDYITKPFDKTELLARVRAGERIVKLESSLRQKNRELSEALAQVKQLKGLLPICMYCKKIRKDKDYWQQIEDYIAHHSEAEFSHGVCPECYEKHSPRYGKREKAHTESRGSG